MEGKARKAGGIQSRPDERLLREEGTVIKDWGGRLPVALVYPNSYYLGMSNVGIHVIYHLLNGYPDVVCERFFRDTTSGNISPLLSAESQRPLTDFAVVAFSVSYELDYFNVAAMLKDSGVPLYAAERDEKHPLFIAGGTCVTANPMPLSPFFDCMCIGEAEAILPEILPLLREGIGDNRQALLKALGSIPGIYTPAHKPETPVVRQHLHNLDDFPATSVVLTPDTELGDLYLIEAERGCSRGCRFCLVNTCYRPMRFRSAGVILDKAREGLHYRKRVGLVGPAVTDHPQIEEILGGLLDMGAGISVSSLRISALSDNIIKQIAAGGAHTITIAPEAGSPLLRRVIKKGISENEIMETVNIIVREGIPQLKLYFMLGLPSETDEDITAIIDLVLVIKELIEKKKSGTRITINMSPFIPKAGTPFQWLPVAPVKVLNRRLSLLKKYLNPKGIRIKTESPAWSQVQATLSRGDAALAPVLANIAEVTLSGWRQALEKCEVDADFYAGQVWSIEQTLPWGIIDSGVSMDYLKSEMEKAIVVI